MRTLKLALLMLSLGVQAAIAQQRELNPNLTIPKVDVELGFDHINANAPPGGCPCFGINGGFVSGGYHITDKFSLVGEFTGGTAGHISTLGQDLTLTTFLGGPRLTEPVGRYAPFGQVLFGGAHGSNSYFPSSTSSTTSATSWALSAGGGLDIDLTRRFGIRAFEVQYLRTNFPNGTSSNWQNQIEAGAGLQIKFGTRGGYRTQPPPPPTTEPAKNEIEFSCSSSASTARAGDTLEIIGHTMTDPDQLDVNYTWTSTGGAIEGVGRRVTLNTAGLAPGNYQVTGHASVVRHPAATADCMVSFRVTYAPPHISCLASATQVMSGQPVNISIGDESTPAPNTTYSFEATGGQIHPNGRTAVLDTQNVSPGDVNVKCRATDGEGQTSEAMVTINVIAPREDDSAKVATVQLCSISFARDPARPTRVDNEGKACLDGIALTLKHYPDARLLIVGTASKKEPNSLALAHRRAANAKRYLTIGQGIDAGRVDLNVSDKGASMGLTDYLVPANKAGSGAATPYEAKP